MRSSPAPAQIAFQLLVALIPLAALTMLLMSAVDAGDVWFDRLQPALQKRVTPRCSWPSAMQFLLAGAVIVLLLAAFGLVAIGGWKFLPVAFVLLWVTIAMLLHLAPADHVEFRWVSVGSVLVIVSWLGASLLYGFYVRSVADFESTFGFVSAGLLLTG